MSQVLIRIEAVFFFSVVLDIKNCDVNYSKIRVSTKCEKEIIVDLTFKSRHLMAGVILEVRILHKRFLTKLTEITTD
jgi:hypothetical protein